jgi:hypothetical protein
MFFAMKTLRDILNDRNREILETFSISDISQGFMEKDSIRIPIQSILYIIDQHAPGSWINIGKQYIQFQILQYPHIAGRG